MTSNKKLICPYCGGTRFVEAYQGGYGALQGEGLFNVASIHHTVCLGCGIVIESYVKNPEKLSKRRNSFFNN